MAPIVAILSASQEAADITAASRLGANGYLVKPAEASQLDAMVRAINDFWLTQNTPPPKPPAQRWQNSLANLDGQRCLPTTSFAARVPAGMSRGDI